MQQAKEEGKRFGGIFSKSVVQPFKDAKQWIDTYNDSLKMSGDASESVIEAAKAQDEEFGNWLSSLGKAPAKMDAYNTSVKTMSATSKAAAIGVKALSMAANALIGMGIGIAINFATQKLDELIHKDEIAIDKANELRSAYEQFKKTNSDNIKTLDSLKVEFEELSRGVDDYGKNISLTADQYERYKAIIQQILGISPSLAEGYTTENGLIADKNGLLERAIELQEIENRNELRKITNLQNLKTSMEGYLGAYNQALGGQKGLVLDGEIFGGIEYTNLQNSIYEAFNVNQRKDYNSADLGREILKSLGVEDVEVEIQKYLNEYDSSLTQSFWKDYIAQISQNADKITADLNANGLGFETVGLDEKTFDINLEKLRNAATVYSDIVSASKAAQQSIQADLQNVAQYNESYKDLSSEQAIILDAWVKQFKLDDVVSENFFGSQYIDEDKIANLKNQVNDFVKFLSENDTAKQAINDFFALDKTALSASDWQSQANSLVDSIANALQLTDEEKLQLKVGLKIDDAKFDELISGVQEKLKDEFDGRVGELSFADLEIAYKLENTGEMTFDELKTAIADAKAEVNTLSATLSSLLPELQKLESSFSTLSSAQDELSNFGAITVSTLQSLMDNNLLQYLDTVDGKLQINTQRFLEDADATKTNALLKLQNAMQTDIMNYAIGKTEALSDTAKAAIANLGANVETSGNQAAGASGQYIGFAAAVDAAIKASEGKGINVNSKEISSGIQAIADSYKPWFSALEAVDVSLKTVSKTAKDTANEIKKAFEDAQKSIDNLIKNAMDAEKQRLKGIKQGYQDDLDDLKDRYDEERKEIEATGKAEQKRYENDKKALEDKLDVYKKQTDAQKELLRIEKESADYQKTLAEKQKEVADIAADLAVKKLDTSDEGKRAALELEEELKNKQSDLDDYQADHAYDTAIEAIDKEYERYQEVMDGKIAEIEREKEAAQESHEQKLEDLESEYEAERSNIERKMANVEAQMEREGELRKKALDEINTAINSTDYKTSALYQKMLEWNRLYGTGVDEDVIKMWDAAYSTLGNYNNGQMDVYATLKLLSDGMDDFVSATDAATRSMERLADATRDQNTAAMWKQHNDSMYDDYQAQADINNRKSKGSKGFKTGGLITKDRAIASGIDGESDAVLIKAHVGETVIPNDDPRSAMQIISDFINSDRSISSLMGSYTNTPINQSFNIPAINPISGFDLSKLERVNNSVGDIKIDYKFDVAGSIDKETLPPLKKILEMSTEHTMGEIKHELRKGGMGRNMRDYT